MVLAPKTMHVHLDAHSLVSPPCHHILQPSYWRAMPIPIYVKYTIIKVSVCVYVQHTKFSHCFQLVLLISCALLCHH